VGSTAGLEEAGLVGEDDELGAVSGAEFCEQAGDVGFDGGGGQHRCLGHFLVRPAAGEESEHVEFACGQLGQAAC
jgi:hypothetical protein